MTDERHAVVRLDRELAGDTDGRKLQSIQRRLQAGNERCRAALDEGVSPSEASRIERLMKAYEAALDLVPILWRLQHQQEQLPQRRNQHG